MTAPEGQPTPPTNIAGYRVERVLAVTAMATVYLVHSPTLPRREVLKVLQPEHANGDHVRAQFLHEADITAGSNIPTSCACSAAARPTPANCGSPWSTSREPTPRLRCTTDR